MASLPVGGGMPPGSTPPLMCKIELPSTGGGDEQYGGTRAIQQAYTFSVDKQIGEGTYGQVFMGNDKVSNDKVALKKIRMDTEKEGFPITAIREIKILSTLHHENVVNLREIVRSEIHKNNNYKGSIYMVFDYADYDLTGLMETVKYRFTEAQVKCIMKQLLKGLAYVHGNGVLHRDLKASNILIDSKGSVKLADFGLARTFQDRQEGRLTNRVITLWYRPPELLLGAERYGPEIDMWSVGCIFAELLVGKPIFPGKDETDQVDQIFRITGTPTEATWPGVSKYQYYDKVPRDKYKGCRLKQWVKDSAAKHGVTHQIKEDAVALLERMLALDPSKRITALDAFQDPWFWNDPMPCDPQALPCGGSSHEFTMKKRRIEEKEREDQQRMAAQQMQQHHHMQQQQMQRGGQQGWGGGGGQDNKRARYNGPGGGPGGAPGAMQGRGPGPVPGGGGQQRAPITAHGQAGGYRPGGGSQAPLSQQPLPPQNYRQGAGAAPHAPYGPGTSGGAAGQGYAHGHAPYATGTAGSYPPQAHYGAPGNAPMPVQPQGGYAGQQRPPQGYPPQTGWAQQQQQQKR